MIVTLAGVPYPATLALGVLHVHTLPDIRPAVLCSTLYVERTASGTQGWYVGRITGNSGITLYQTTESGDRFKHRSPLEITMDKLNLLDCISHGTSHAAFLAEYNGDISAAVEHLAEFYTAELAETGETVDPAELRTAKLDAMRELGRL